MARPTSKNDLILASNEQYDKLMTLLNSLSDEQVNRTFNFDLYKLS